MIHKRAAILFGIVFLLVGILGFVPGVTTNEMLLGIFHVNAAHNVVHLLSGAAALACGLASPRASRLYFRIFGAVYGLVAILGMVHGDGHLLGLISNNMPDVWLHVAISIAALVLGFVVRDDSTETRRV
jgi:hypothetical protein